MDPLSGREVDLLDRLPEPVAVDQLGLVQTVDHLSEGVAPRAAGLADREVLARLKGSLWWTIPAEAEVLARLKGSLVVDDPGGGLLAAPPDRHLQCVEGEPGPEAGHNPPAGHRPAEDVDDEGPWRLINSALYRPLTI